MNKKYVILDFEFREVTEKFYDLVCVCGMTLNEGVKNTFSYWLHQTPEEQDRFKAFFNQLLQDGFILIAWSATAELRCLMGLGIDIDKISVIDSQVEFKLYANCDAYRRWREEAEHKAKAKAKRDGKRYVASQGKFSLDVASLVLLNEVYEEKKDMQKLIVSSPSFSPSQKQAILEYCAKDIIITYRVFCETSKYLLNRFSKLRESYFFQALRRGDYVKACTWIEFFGYPVDTTTLKKISDNAALIEEGFIREYSEDIVECFIRDVEVVKRVPNPNWSEGSKERKTIMQEMTLREHSFSNEVFAEKLKKFGLDRDWPVSEKMQAKHDEKGNGKRAYLVDMETLDERKGLHPFIAELASLKRKQSCLKYLTKESKPDDPLSRTLVESISKEDRIHCYLNPFGTTTGRNAPPAAKFIFAQSSWERVLIRPKPGRVIIGLDYAGQEILIGALATGDENLEEDYHSGDPYTNFAIGAELLETESLIKYRNKEVTLAQLKTQYSDFRTKVLKPVFLGLGYGLGKEKLARSIDKPLQEAEVFYKAHKRRYREYWKDTSRFVEQLSKSGDYYQLYEDWGIYECSNYTTLVNWRIQATGGVILRNLAIELTKKRYRERNIQVICLLHDAIYVEVDIGEEQEISKEIEKVMIDLFHDVLPSEKKIRIEYDYHYPDGLWIEDKAKRTWENIKQFIVD